MKRTGCLFAYLVICLLTTGCAVTNPMAVKQYDDGDFKMFSNSAAVSNTIIRTAGDNRVICAGLAPDVALDENANAALSISMMNIGDKAHDSLGEGETEAGLGGRSANVLITREILYRQCELFGNTNLDDDTKQQIFQDTLDALVKINSVNLGTGTRATAGDTAPGSSNDDDDDDDNEILDDDDDDDDDDSSSSSSSSSSTNSSSSSSNSAPPTNLVK